jgi:hypothetical protein
MTRLGVCLVRCGLAAVLLSSLCAPALAKAKDRVRVVNVGGPFRGEQTERGRRADFRHVALEPGDNTVVKDVNSTAMRRLFGAAVRFLRASWVPFTPVRSGKWVDPDIFARQARRMGVKHIAVATGRDSIWPLFKALRRGGFSVRLRGRHPFITARPR